jgi:trehalose 6-phosphate phosphatase
VPEPTWIDAAAEPLRRDPARGAVLLDLDGTLAPIVARPEDSAVSERSRAALERIAARYALTAIVTGRPGLVAREIAGLDGITYAGNHGFELLRPGASEADPAPALAGRIDDARRFLAEADVGDLRVEDKGSIMAVHWRGATDEAAAERHAESLAAAAEDAGLAVHRGRMVLEIRPPVEIDKGVAIAALLAEADVEVALYAGDDRTDLDAFRALDRLRDAGELGCIVRVGVRSQEGPAELLQESDVVAPDAESVPDLLEALAA